MPPEAPIPLSEKQHDEALMPMIMGSPRRVPYYAYEAWGLPTHTSEAPADKEYDKEWKFGNAQQLGLVTDAIVEAGFSNFPELLRRKTGEIVASLLKDRTDSESLKIMDIGAGPGQSALAIVEALPVEMQSRVTMILVDPSERSLATAAQLMNDKEIKFEVLHGIDSDILNSIELGSIDVLTGIASAHHHAEIPFDKYTKVLKEKGFAVFGDWHQSIWEHPGSTLRFLKEFEWAKKKECLKHWVEIYPEAQNIPSLPDNPADRMAMEQITKFWLAYKRIADEANLGPNALWPLEGHRPVQRYVEDMRRAGFSLNTPDIKRALENSYSVKSNPQQILPDSSLLQLIVGQKVHANL